MSGGRKRIPGILPGSEVRIPGILPGVCSWRTHQAGCLIFLFPAAKVKDPRHLAWRVWLADPSGRMPDIPLPDCEGEDPRHLAWRGGEDPRHLAWRVWLVDPSGRMPDIPLPCGEGKGSQASCLACVAGGPIWQDA